MPQDNQGFEGWIGVLTASVAGPCLRFTSIKYRMATVPFGSLYLQVNIGKVEIPRVNKWLNLTV